MHSVAHATLCFVILSPHTHTLSSLSLSLSHTHTHALHISISLSLSHTHTHTHFISIYFSLSHTHRRGASADFSRIQTHPILPTPSPSPASSIRRIKKKLQPSKSKNRSKFKFTPQTPSSNSSFVGNDGEAVIIDRPSDVFTGHSIGERTHVYICPVGFEDRVKSVTLYLLHSSDEVMRQHVDASSSVGASSTHFAFPYFPDQVCVCVCECV
jgi:hypothetical protein